MRVSGLDGSDKACIEKRKPTRLTFKGKMLSTGSWERWLRGKDLMGVRPIQ